MEKNFCLTCTYSPVGWTQGPLHQHQPTISKNWMLFNYRQLKCHNLGSLVTFATVTKPLIPEENAHYWVFKYNQVCKCTQSLDLRTSLNYLYIILALSSCACSYLCVLEATVVVFNPFNLYLTTSVTSYFADLSLIQNINQLCKYVKLLNRLEKFSAHLPVAHKCKVWL